MLTDSSVQIYHPGSDFILKRGIERLLLGGIPIHTSVSDFVESMLPSLHDFYGEIVGGIVVKQLFKMLNVLLRVHVYIVLCE